MSLASILALHAKQEYFNLRRLAWDLDGLFGATRTRVLGYELDWPGKGDLVVEPAWD